MRVLIQRAEDGGIPIGFGQLGDIAVQLLLPFLAGQMLRRWISDWLGRHRAVISVCDRASIPLVVYSAFSRGMTTGIWQRVSPARPALLGTLCALLLGVVLLLANRCARVLRLPRGPGDRGPLRCHQEPGQRTAHGLRADSGGPVAVIVLPLMHTLQRQADSTFSTPWARSAGGRCPLGSTPSAWGWGRVPTQMLMASLGATDEGVHADLLNSDDALTAQARQIACLRPQETLTLRGALITRP
ncbi:bile acid:sodium symporter [Streptomyces rhizosphaericus]|uniref:Uncharacterized protein n=1 Tax=Streptomyces rhizosphaericus TaxID=114699 RepID=A0ABP4AWD5_9ACTN|nr:bile acid:sodium symporter [Streptomyces cangkringensis]